MHHVKNCCFIKLFIIIESDVCACATMKCTYYTALKFSLVIIALIYNQLGAAAWVEEERGLSEEYSSTSKAAGQCSIISNNSCPTWYVSSVNGSCRCGKCHGIISCDEDRYSAAVLNCYYVSYDPSLNEAVAGACFFNCEPHRKHQFTNGMYMVLPCNIQELDNQTCRPFKRTGRLCGKCLPGYSPLAYSYNMTCVECPNGSKNWWKFILVAFGPLTIFYFLILFFHINAISSSLHAVLIYSLTVASSTHIRITLFALERHFINPTFITTAKILVTLYGVWNLDFFRAFLPNICLNLGTLPTLALDCVVAIYPLVLIIITYFLIDLYDRNFRPLIWIWKPFRKVFMVFKRKWNCKTSLIDAFATFFLLSFNKIMNVSSDLLTPVKVYTAQSSKGAWAPYYDGSIDYFGKQHLPYAVLGLLFLVVFVIIPVVILLFYQSRYFQKLLNCFPLPWYILHTFADSFQGCFKNGTESGTRDCRWFAGAYFVLRVALFLVYAFTLQTIYFSISSIVLLFFIILLVKVQPYKRDMAYQTNLNAMFLVMIVLLYVSIAGYNFSHLVGPHFTNSFYAVIALLAIAPLIYLTYIAVRWVLSRRIIARVLIQRFRARKNGYETLPSEDIPHRLLHPDAYTS